MKNSYTFNAMLTVILDPYNVTAACDFSLVLLFYIGDGLSSQPLKQWYFNLMKRKVKLKVFSWKKTF